MVLSYLNYLKYEKCKWGLCEFYFDQLYFGVLFGVGQVEFFVFGYGFVVGGGVWIRVEVLGVVGLWGEGLEQKVSCDWRCIVKIVFICQDVGNLGKEEYVVGSWELCLCIVIVIMVFQCG